MKKDFTYGIAFVTRNTSGRGGKRVMTITEEIADIGFGEVKKELRDQLDVAIRPDGKPYRPDADALKPLYHYCPAGEISEIMERYRESYDLYDELTKTIESYGIPAGSDSFTYFRTFKPFGMTITVTAKRKRN